MEEVIACRNDTPDNLLFVAGGGAWVDKSSIMWRIFMKEAKALGLSFSTVDGIHKEKKGGSYILRHRVGSKRSSPRRLVILRQARQP